jgi:hypothetical protein
MAPRNPTRNSSPVRRRQSRSRTAFENAIPKDQLTILAGEDCNLLALSANNEGADPTDCIRDVDILNLLDEHGVLQKSIYFEVWRDKNNARELSVDVYKYIGEGPLSQGVQANRIQLLLSLLVNAETGACQIDITEEAPDGAEEWKINLRVARENLNRRAA